MRGAPRSLGASLSYGFGTAFSEDERRILALLHLFQGFVDVDVLRTMGHPEAEWCLDAVRGLARERGIPLLDRAAEIGLLVVHGEGYYGIHPALPWYFRALFARYFSEGSGDALRARRAFGEAMGKLGDFYHREYNEGRRQVLELVAAEEDNLLAAWHLARANGWWSCVISTMQGLETLYGATGRRAAWLRLVAEVVPDFVDPTTDGPLSGREDEWSLVTQYRVHLAEGERDWVKAERLQSLSVDRDRHLAQLALAVAPDRRDARQRNRIRSLAASLHELAEIRRDLGSPASADTYREAFNLADAIGDSAGQAICAFNLGSVYLDVADLRDLDQAEGWYRKSLNLRAAGDGLGRGLCLGQLGHVAYRRFLNGREANDRAEELANHLEEAAQHYQQALDLMPATAVTERGTIHNQLGAIYNNAGDIDRGLHHFRECIRYGEQEGDIFVVGRRRYNVAIALLRVGRFPDARAYAVAALENFRTFGDRAAADVQRTEQLIGIIDGAIAKQSGAG